MEGGTLLIGMSLVGARNENKWLIVPRPKDLTEEPNVGLAEEVGGEETRARYEVCGYVWRERKLEEKDDELHVGEKDFSSPHQKVPGQVT